MAKTCPSCGYSPIGPYIDNCPICAEPVRHGGGGSRRRSADGDRPAPAQSPSMQWVLFGGGGVALLALVIAAMSGGMGGRQRPPVDKNDPAAVEQVRDAQRKARTRVVTAAQLLREFQESPAMADQKYKGLELEITGVVENTGKDGADTPFVVVHAGDENAKLKIECFFDSAEPADERRISQLTKGRPVTVRGEYDGRVTNLQIRECVLVR